MATSGHEDQGELARPIKENGIYSNPFDTWKFFGRLDVLKWTSSSLKDNSGIPWGNPEVRQGTMVGAMSENLPPVMCAQRRFRSACAFAQSDQNLHWALFG